MKILLNQKGYVAVIVVAFIVAIALAMVGVSMYFKEQVHLQAKGSQNPANINVATNTNTANQNANTNTFGDVTKNWKVFKNSTYGYSMRLPTDWNPVSEMDGSPLPLVDNRSDVSFGQDNSQAGFMISVGTADEVYKTTTIADFKKGKTVTSEQQVTFNNITFTKLQYSEQGSGKLTYLVEHNNSLIVINPETNNTTQLEAILATFAFYDPTADWKIYTNTNLGISFKYPSDSIVNTTCLDNDLIRIAYNTDVNKDKKCYTDASGPGPIGIKKYDQYKSDLKTFATQQSGTLGAEQTLFHGHDAYWVRGITDEKTNPAGKVSSWTNVESYYVNIDNSTWGFEYQDLNSNTTSYNDFFTFLTTIQFF